MPTYIVLACFACLIFGYFTGSIVAAFTYGYKYRALCKKVAKTSPIDNPYL